MTNAWRRKMKTGRAIEVLPEPAFGAHAAEHL